jgi:acetyl esterase/lipase
MKRFFTAALAGIVSLSCGLAQEPKQQKRKKLPEPPEGVEVLRDIEFHDPKDGGGALRLDLYRPKDRAADAKLPVVVWIHGGGWLNGSKDRCPANWLAQHGFAVASVEYRLTDRAIWPAQIEDCQNAVIWLKKRAADYGLNSDNVGAWGSSAGGHLVALMGTRPVSGGFDLARVKAVCDWFGPTKLLTMPPNMVANGRTDEDVAKSNGAKLLGVTVKDAPEKAKDASAIDHVSPGDAAFLIMHGSDDPGVPIEQSTLFHEKLRSVGVESELHIVEGAGHGGKEFQADEVRSIVLKFFQTQLQ